MTTANSGLEPFRKRIDDLDRQITTMVAERLKICAEVAIYKKDNAIPMMQPDRVEAVKDRCAALGVSKGLRADFVRALYALIIEEACHLEDELIAAH